MDIEKLTSLLEFKPVKINENLCSRKISPKSKCQRCLASCPIQGISLKNNVPQIKDCVSCGLCVTACPNHVFKLEEEQLLQLDYKLNNHLILTCPLMIDKIAATDRNKITKISCLKQLYPELLLKLLTRFNKVVLVQDKNTCKGCLPKQNYQVDLADFHDIFSGELFAKLHIVSDYSKIKEYVQGRKSLSSPDRRSFFKAIFSGTRNLSTQVLDDTLQKLNIENDSSNQDSAVPSKKRYLLDALRSTDKIKEAASLPYPDLSITLCNLCGVCAKLCPTNALKINTINDTKELTFLPQLCTHCDLCLDVCFFQGINWRGQIKVEDFLSDEPQILAHSTRKICRECEQDFYFHSKEKQDLCFLCRQLRNGNKH